MDNHIKIWNNFFPAKHCDQTLYEFELIVNDPQFKDKVHVNRSQFTNGALGREDVGIFLEDIAFNRINLVEEYLACLQTCIVEYIEYYPALKHFNLTNRHNIKIQRTMPLGGYHVWHCERDGTLDHNSRELAWMIYLNDMPEHEAETEFLYQAVKIRPTKGTVVIWPAGFTHVHRGLTVYTRSKYIATGWYHSF